MHEWETLLRACDKLGASITIDFTQNDDGSPCTCNMRIKRREPPYVDFSGVASTLDRDFTDAVCELTKEALGSLNEQLHRHLRGLVDAQYLISACLRGDP